MKEQGFNRIPAKMLAFMPDGAHVVRLLNGELYWCSKHELAGCKHSREVRRTFDQEARELSEHLSAVMGYTPKKEEP